MAEQHCTLKSLKTTMKFPFDMKQEHTSSRSAGGARIASTRCDEPNMTSGLSVTKEIVFSGPFLKCNVLRLSALAASWNGQAIIPSFPSDLSNDLVQIHYNSTGATMQDGREGKALHVVHITMPNGVQVEVNRWNEPGEGSYINVRITMPSQPGQDGHCGNFNGNPADDDRLHTS